jgi:hypothetical protein
MNLGPCANDCLRALLLLQFQSFPASFRWSFFLFTTIPPLCSFGIRRDRKKKKYMGAKEKPKIRTESGQKISASYKTGIYDDWLNKSKANRSALVFVVLTFFDVAMEH